MKSIMEEASTIFKAIEKAWLRAEKPQSFSVKVLEEPTKNFFGMTTKSAKIALFFGENMQAQPSRHQSPQPQQQYQPKKQAHAKEPVRQQRQQQQPRNEYKEQQQQSQPQKNTENQATWNPELVNAAQTWIKNMLTSLGNPADFSARANNNQLIVEFNQPLAQQGRDRLLFSSLSYILMQSIRHQFKNQARGLRVVLKVQN